MIVLSKTSIELVQLN